MIQQKKSPKYSSKVTVERPSAVLYAGAPATIKLNGTKMTDVWGGATSSFHVPAGQNAVSASAWSYPGEYTVKLNAVAGQNDKLIVEPRGASFLPAATLARFSHEGSGASWPQAGSVGKASGIKRMGSYG